MIRKRFRWLTLLAALIVIGSAAAPATADDDDAKERKITLGKATIVAPKGWEKKKPRSRILAYEFHAPAAEDDETDGRMTVMKAGGTLEANLQRWYRSFRQPDGKPTEERAKVEKDKIAGRTVYLVDIPGTYTAPPFAGGGTYEKYRLLAGIIEGEGGNWFVRLLGPQQTIAKHEKAFKHMIESLEVE